MKKSLFIVAAILVGLLVGCADNNVNNPAAPTIMSGSSAPVVGPNSGTGSIALDCVLSFGNDLEVPQTFQIKGDVQYDIRMPAHNILPREIYSVSVTTSATVLGLNPEGSTGTAYAKSAAALEIMDTPTKYEQVAVIEGLPNSMALYVQLIVSKNQASLGNVWLAPYRQSANVTAK